VEFEQPGIEILNRENVAIIAKLCLKADPSVQFLVATTHLLYNPRRQDIRLAQVQILLAELDRHAQMTDSSGQKAYMPVILTGDFNLTDQSAPFNLITSGSLNYANLSPKTLQFNKGPTNQSNGRRLLPVKLGISDECQHFNEIKVSHADMKV
jgi:protein angel